MSEIDWKPTKPASQYTDEELRGTPPFSKLKEALSKEPSGALLIDNDNSLTVIVRKAIAGMWNQLHPEQAEDEDEGDGEDDDGELRSYDISVEVPLTLHFQVEAHDEDDAYEVAREELHQMRFKTYIHAMTAEMLGVEDRNGPMRDLTFDHPENPSDGEITVDES